MTPPRLYRSRRHRMIAGVCGGLAERYDWDPSVVRLVFILASFLPIPTHMVLLYIIMWIVIPEAPE
jgi:phage shock protein C